TGTLGGLAAEPGTYELFLVKDGKVQRYALTVAAPSAPRARYELTAGVATNLVVGGVTGCDAYALPDGLAWDKATATLSGAARAAGTNTVYFVRGYGDDTQFFSTVLCVAAGTAVAGPGDVTPGGPTEGPGDVPGTPGTQPEQEHPGVVDPGTVPEEKTSFAVLASVQLEGEARGTAKVSTESVPRGESVKLTARAANGKTLFAYWQEKGGGIVGYAANLTVTPTRDSEYVAVFRAKSVCAEPAFDGDGFASVATNAMVGVQFRTRIPVDSAAYPVRFTGSRLPNGLTIDAATGEIKGVPVKAGTFVATVKAVSRANVSKRATVQLAITVIPLPDWAQGTFEGALEGDGEDGDLRGVAHATVSSRGRISGKLMERGTNFVFTVNGYDASSRFTDGVTNLVVSATAKAGKVTQAFAATMLDAGLAGRLGDSDVWLARSPWKDAAMAAKLAPFVGLYTVQFVSDGSAGHGYLSLMVDKAGSVKATGKLADGTAVSTTLPLLWDDAAEAPYVVFFVAPTAYAGGYAYETIRFDAQKRIRGEGGLWLNLAPTATADYGEGFGCSFASRGAWYNTLAALRDSYGTLAFKADAPDLATPVKVTDEDENGKSATTTVTEWQAAVDLDCWNTLTVALDAKGTGFAVAKTTKPVQDKTTKAWIYAGENDAGLSLAFKQATGIFSGSFTCWYDYVSARDYLKDTETLAHTSKTVKFEGISVQGDPALRGFGLWEATGSYEDEKTGKEKTYKVVESYPVVFE
ncbi:MAG: Ig domain-containing protein, partial [Kiritimatiellae bacterium]|nr:Ig domain-containing protein [Kiritimatiellia bacterium]